MPTIDLTDSTFAKTIEDNSIVLVDFWAAWCGPCRAFAPRFSDASDQHPDVVFAKVDTDAEQHLASMAGIQSIPTLMAFKDQVLVFSQPGALNGPQLEQVVASVKALDMDAVRAQLAADDAAGPSEIAPGELSRLRDVVLIDVREPGEFAQARVAGAVNIPLGELPSRLQDVPEDRTVYVMCQSGNRSARASALLAEQGRDVVNVQGGIGAWQRAGLPVLQGA